MSIQVRFTMERPDTSKEFWWEATDPEIAQMCKDVDLLANLQNVNRTYTKSDDGLSCVSEFLAPDRDTWNVFMNTVVTAVPGMLEKRNAYLKESTHTIHMKMVDISTDEVHVETLEPSWEIITPA